MILSVSILAVGMTEWPPEIWAGLIVYIVRELWKEWDIRQTKKQVAAATVKAAEASGKAETATAIGNGATKLADAANERSGNNAKGLNGLTASLNDVKQDVATVFKAAPSSWFVPNPDDKPAEPSTRDQ